MTLPPRAGALDFLIRWYALPANQQHTPSLHDQGGMAKILGEAKQIATFLEQDEVPLIVTVLWRWGQITEQGTGEPATHPHRPEGEAMQLTDTQEVTFTIAAQDSKGNAVNGDSFTATVDNTAVVTVTGPDATTGEYTVAAVEPGTGAILTVTDGAGITVTESFDVVAGSAATIALTFGTPTEEPAPTPTPAP